MTDIPLRIWLLRLTDLLGGFTFGDLERVLAAGEKQGATPVDPRMARWEVRCLVEEQRLVEFGARFTRAPRLVEETPPAPRQPVIVTPMRLREPPQLSLFGGGQ